MGPGYHCGHCKTVLQGVHPARGSASVLCKNSKTDCFLKRQSIKPVEEFSGSLGGDSNAKAVNSPPG